MRLVLFSLLQFVFTHTSPLHSYKGVTVSELIKYAEAAMYEPLLSPHLRFTREVGMFSKPLRISFKAHNRGFVLVLRPDPNIFADDVSFESTSGSVLYDTHRVYTGYLEGEEDSMVQGVLTADGLFDGTLVSKNVMYYIEPKHRYEPSTDKHQTQQINSVHSVIYKTTDVVMPQQTCASELLRTSRDKRSSHNISSLPILHSTYEISESNILKTYVHAPQGNRARKRNDTVLFKFPKFSNEVRFYNNVVNRPKLVKIVNRTIEDCTFEELLPNGTLKHVIKRATVDPKKTTCMLYLQADHLFYQKYGTEEACIEVMTRHVQRVNSIYKMTDFNQDGRSDNISFMIKRIKVHTTDASKDPGYRFPGNYGVEKFLELFSEEDYDAFCLAYMFTYRDFEMGTLGLAWTGDLKNAGGVCEKNGHYRGSLKSLNTGIVTLLNYGKHVPPAVSHVTLAHEIGHNFGSPHDPETCTPGGEDGNYIMFARATSGDKKNNNKFSPCSLNSINPVLNTKARSHMGCFTEPQSAICGNGVVEDGEECDCGWEEDCRDTCCYPQRRYPPSGEPPCRLTPHSICSPSQGPCCTSECRLKFGDKCRDDNGCRDSSYCDGRAPSCPPSVNKPNKTICNDELVCFMGECTGSICLAYGLESCQCIPGPKDPLTKACELCCKKPGDDQPCLSSFDWNELPFDIPDMFSKPGTPCNDYNGYCDVFQKCREVDPSGPLATLRKLLLSEESLASFKRWVAQHWYAVLIIVTTIIIVLVLSTKLLGKQQDLKLKSITIIHSATTETVRLPPEGDAAMTVHPPQVRTKLPLHRKVREKKLHTRMGRKRQGTTADGDAAKVSKGKPYTRKVSQEPRKKTERAKKDLCVDQDGKSRLVIASPRVSCDVPAPALVTVPTLVPARAADTSEPVYENLPRPTTSAASGKVISSRLKKSNKVSTEEAMAKSKKSVHGTTNFNSPVKRSIAKKTSPSKRRKRKDVIVYKHEDKTKAATTAASLEDPLGKVQNWLMHSISTGRPSENFGIMTLTLPKSKSSPVGLSSTSKPDEPVTKPLKIIHKQDKVMQIPKLTQKRSRSAGNLRKDNKKDDKVKLQVVYKPPFKISVKLRNNKVLSSVGAKVAEDKNGDKKTELDPSDKPHITGLLVRPRIAENATGNPFTFAAGVALTTRQNPIFLTDHEDIDSNVHTVPSDLDVLLSESEFLFSDA